MLIELSDLAIYLFLLVLYLICGYGVDKDLNKVHGYENFNFGDIFVILTWPIVILVRSINIVWDDLK